MNIFKFMKKDRIWMYEQIKDGRAYTSNGVMILVSDDTIPNNVVKRDDIKYANLKGMIDSTDFSKSIEEFPTKASLRECIRDIQNGDYSKRVAYCFGEITVNAKFLLEALNYLGENVTMEYSNYKNPLKIDNGKNQIYICPIDARNSDFEEGYFYEM